MNQKADKSIFEFAQQFIKEPISNSFIKQAETG